MTKHTQTIRQQQPTNYLSVFNHFVGLVLKGLKNPFTLKNDFEDQNIRKIFIVTVITKRNN